MAKAMGMNAFDVSEPDAVEQTIKEALAEKGPVLVNFFTNTDEIPAFPNFKKP